MISARARVHPSVTVWCTAPWMSERHNEYEFWVGSDGKIDIRPPYLWKGNVEVTPDLDFHAFTQYGLYEVVFWTLANKTYRCNITFSSVN